MKGSEIVGMWIVALSLVGAVGAQSALQELPRLDNGLQVMAQDEARTPDLAEVLQGISKRLFKC